MSILIVDDSRDSVLLLKTLLNKAGYNDLLIAESAVDAFQQLGMFNSSKKRKGVDLILMDIMMPEIDGIEACRRIKARAFLRNTPIVMVTAQNDDTSLKKAFNNGAIDYVTKPFKKTELLVRVKSILRLKHEIDERTKVTLRLEEANKKLKLLSSIDGLTNIGNRRHFDRFLNKEWYRAIRDSHPISLLMIDVDNFKAYNDNYGHLAGDDCLKKVAGVLSDFAKRPGDIVARYGGEEFALVFPDTKIKYGIELAERARTKLEALKIPHQCSEVSDMVTVSIGVATMFPQKGMSPSNLIEAADKMLYQAKKGGRNKIDF